MLATTSRKIDDDLVELAEGIGYGIVRGDLEDVLSRFRHVKDIYGAEKIVR